jgi:hypothetical protein
MSILRFAQIHVESRPRSTSKSSIPNASPNAVAAVESTVDASAFENIASIDPEACDVRSLPAAPNRTARAIRLRHSWAGGNQRVQKLPDRRPDCGAARTGEFRFRELNWNHRKDQTLASTDRTRSANAVVQSLREQLSIDIERRVEMALLEIESAIVSVTKISPRRAEWLAHRRR